METHNEEKRGQFGGTSPVQIRSRWPSGLMAESMGQSDTNRSEAVNSSHWNTWRFESLGPVLIYPVSKNNFVFEVIHRLGHRGTPRVEPRRASGLNMDTWRNISWFSAEQKNEALLNSCLHFTVVMLSKDRWTKRVLLSTTETVLKILC